MAAPLICSEVGAESGRQQWKHAAVNSSSVVVVDGKAGHDWRWTSDVLGVLDAANRVGVGRHGKGQRLR